MKKRKKRSVLSKKEKLFLIIGAIVIFLVILATVLTIGNKGKPIIGGSNSDEINEVLTTVEDTVAYLESSFISMSDSNTNGYDLDIFVSFKYDLYENDKSNELYFTNFYEKIAVVTGFKSFRIIDSEKDIAIEVKCNSNGIYEVKINGEINYFRKKDSDISTQKIPKIETLNLEINSPALQEIINNKWNAKNAQIGSKESSFYKYDIYFDEGYEIRNIHGKVFNIVFTNKYNQKVVGGYKPGDNLEKIEEDLGECYKESGIIGYKTNSFYVWFSQDEISIYPIYKTDYTKFEELVKEYAKNPDANDFMYKVTDIWNDYSSYISNQNYVEICFANKGVKFQYSVAKPIGVEIYGNYTGDLKDEIGNIDHVYYRLDKNLTAEAEVSRLDNKRFYDDNDIENDPIHYSTKFQLLLDVTENGYNNVKIQSLDGEYPNNEFDETIKISTYVWADDYHLIYSVRGDGIYIYDARNRTTNNLISGQQEFNITNYDRHTNIIEYDDSQAQITI